MEKMLLATKNYLSKHNYSHFDIKATLFDMDGVLYDSMRWHAKSWYESMSQFGLDTVEDEFYLYEGMVSGNTINTLIMREKGRPATDDEKRDIYSLKTELFNKYNDGSLIPYAHDFVQRVSDEKLICTVVTGSGQKALLGRLNDGFPNLFSSELMVTAYDVKHGKPHPEPYLMGLEKSGNLAPNQAIVIENAPRGVEAAVAAGIFTIAINTGPIEDKVLEDSGADIVLPSMQSLYENWDTMKKYLGL